MDIKEVYAKIEDGLRDKIDAIQKVFPSFVVAVCTNPKEGEPILVHGFAVIDDRPWDLVLLENESRTAMGLIVDKWLAKATTQATAA